MLKVYLPDRTLSTRGLYIQISILDHLCPCNPAAYIPMREKDRAPKQFVLERYKGSRMKEFATWTTILMNDLHALKQLEGPDEASQVRYVMKEQEIGQHCCQAGENLTDAELVLLKRVLHLTEQQWRAYKSKIRPASE
jgi:hypothetical protein